MSASDFKLIRPITITDAILTSSTVPEATVAAYAGGTTYALGDRAGVTTGTAQTVYQSLQAGNIGHTPASSPTWWLPLSVVYSAYSGAVTYALGDVVSSISADVHLLYESLAASNLGNALTNVAKWLPLGATNRAKMFDQAVNSQTAMAESIVVVLTPGEIINSVTLLNVDAATVTVSQSISGYSKAVNMNSHNVLSWYDFYYEEVLRTGDVIFSDIPPYAAGVLTITISSPGGTAACGCLIVGKSRVIGTTKWECVGSVNDYSVVTEDAYGNRTATIRPYSKLLDLEVAIAPGFESEAVRILALHRATPMVFVGSEDYAMTIIYGILGPWSVPVSNSGKPATIQIKGMT